MIEPQKGEVPMDAFMDTFSLILKILTAYTAIIGVCFFLPRRKRKPVPPSTRFAVLIPARNEEAVIPNIIRCLRMQSYPKEKYDIYVIPNNCTDDTEGAARRAGAMILRCARPVKTKGEVLHQIFGQLKGQYDAYCVFDADNLVHPDFLARMNDAVADGAEAAKSRQVASNPYDSWVSGCYDIYFENFNLMYNRPRAALGLNAKLIGTGFMITDSLLDKLGGWNTVTLTEDMEFAAQCAEAGVRIHYVTEAPNYDEQPTTFRASLRQRRRWSAGVMQTANLYVPRLLTKGPKWLRLDMAVNLMMIYVQLLAAVPTAYALWGLTLPVIAKTLVISLVSFWLGTSALALFLTITGLRNPLKMWKSILLYPLFVASWYPLHVLSLVNKPKTWKPIVHKGVPTAPVLTARDNIAV